MGIFYYETQLGRSKLALSTATTTNAANYARMMIERAEVAIDELTCGASEDVVWKFYHQGLARCPS